MFYAVQRSIESWVIGWSCNKHDINRCRLREMIDSVCTTAEAMRCRNNCHSTARHDHLASLRYPEAVVRLLIYYDLIINDCVWGLHPKRRSVRAIAAGVMSCHGPTRYRKRVYWRHSLLPSS